MKRLIIILFILMYGVSTGQTWQPADPSGVMYFEPITGTNIIITPSSITIGTTAVYTGVHTSTGMEIIAYDSIGHFVNKWIVIPPYKDTEICRRVYDYTVTVSGELIFIIHGVPDNQTTPLCYSINIPTYRAQQKYEEYLKSIYR